jgi:hypothetical protein
MSSSITWNAECQGGVKPTETGVVPAFAGDADRTVVPWLGSLDVCTEGWKLEVNIPRGPPVIGNC